MKARWRAGTTLAVLLAVVVLLAVAVLIVGGGVLWSRSHVPVHKDPASVPSRGDAPLTDRYTGPVENARQLARALVAADNLPGLSVAVAVKGEIAWAEGFGWADVDTRTPITPRTRFRLGALSKPLTAVAAARLHDEGRLDLDAPVQRYVPAYPGKAWPITARQLMGDVAGVHRIRGDNNDAMPTAHCEDLDDAVALLADDPLLFEPGSQHRYSIWGWTLVSAVVQGAAGQPFARVMDRELFEPLGMTRTVVAETEDLVDVAHADGRRPDYSCLAGGGAFLSTPTDLVRLGSAMLQPGFLQADTIADFQRPTRLASGASTTYALGWTVASARLGGAQVQVVSHRGSPAGGTVSLLTFPDRGLAVAVAANATDAKAVGPFALEVAEAFSRRREAPAVDEALRPQFHFTPARNFMNDPNGLVFYKGEYHLFYQHNPFGETWGHMSWGHAVSPDMLHWQHLPVALREEQGVMIFSGSVVVDWHNSSGFCEATANDRSCLVAVYTGHGPGRQTQNLAYSNDRGRTWTKYARNPVVDLGLKDFRDPKAFWHEPTRRWIMVTVLPDQHKVRFFASPDLKSWTPASDFGPAGATGGVWECPDLFELPIEGEPGRTRWVLDVDINPGGIDGGSAGQYFVGTFDGTRFVADHPPDQTLWADYGKDFYASLSFSDMPDSDRRRIWMGWISNWQYANVEPTTAWRGAQSVPRTLALRRGPNGLRLVQAPVAELETLRTTPQPIGISRNDALPPSAEILLEVKPGDWRETGVRLSNSAGEEVIVGIARTPLEVFVDRRKSRLTPFHAEYPGRHAGPVAWRDGTITLRILFDRSVVEVFANDGETVVTDRVFPTQALDKVERLPQVEPRPAAKMWTLGSGSTSRR